MKSKFLVLATAFFIFTVFGCDKKATDLGFEVGQSFDLAFDQTGISSNGQIEVHFKNVASDSRCPADVQCIWEGEATIDLAVKVNSVMEEISLSTHPDFGQRDTVSQFIFTLLDLQPYPCCHQQETDEEDYIVELLIEAL